LRSRLALNASVRRDGSWKIILARDLVPGDVIKLSLGAVVAADVKLTSGEVLLDQSMLTGESVPVEAGAGFQTFAGALVRRGEAVAPGRRHRCPDQVRANRRTGPHRPFGQFPAKAVLLVVRYLAGFNGAIIVLMIAYAWFLKTPITDIVPLVLTAILASIPVAPARHFYAGGSARCARFGEAERSADPALGRRRSRDDGCSMRG